MPRIKYMGYVIDLSSSDEDSPVARVRPVVAAMLPSAIPVLPPVSPARPSVAPERPSVVPVRLPVPAVRPSTRRRTRMLVIGASSFDDDVPTPPPVRYAPPPDSPLPPSSVSRLAVRRQYPRTVLSGDTSAGLVRFPLLCGPSTVDPEANDPHTLDLDAACVTMLTLDLPEMFGIMARPACRKIPVRDLPEFVDWLHVISDHIVVRVYAGDSDEEREAFKASLVESLRTGFGLTLTCASDSLTLSTSQVNVPVSSMSEALYSLGARLCRVAFCGMKWSITSVEAVIDRFIERYRV